METLFAVSGILSRAGAVAARLLIGVLILLVVGDVAVRNLGLRPLAWAVSASEYALLFVAFLPMPWLVRTRGHVFVEFLRGMLPPRARDAMERAVYLACMLLCLYLGWYALDSLVESVRRGTYETRTFDMPKWAVFAPMVFAFLVSAVEWLRFLTGRASMYGVPAAEREGL